MRNAIPSCLVILVIVLCACMTSCSDTPSDPDSSGSLRMQPWKWNVGDEALWRVYNGEGRFTRITYTVVNKYSIGGRHCVKWEDPVKQNWTDEIGTSRFRRITEPITKVLDTFDFVKLPTKRGEYLGVEYVGSTVNTYHTGTPDTVVTVSAGTFRCVEITTTHVRSDGDGYVYSEFFAPGYGFVLTGLRQVGDKMMVMWELAEIRGRQ